MNKTLLIGWDAASQLKKNGFCFADYSDLRLSNIRFKEFRKEEEFVDFVKKLFSEYTKILFCIDTPLGYPDDFSDVQKKIRPGIYDSVPEEDIKNFLFRETERFLIEKLRLYPLSICTEKIAISSLNTFKRINKLKKCLNTDIKVVWSSDYKSQIGIIEIYPASFFKRFNIKCGKKSERYIDIFFELKKKFIFLENELQNLPSSDDQLDSLACVLTGEMFLKGKCFFPENLELAKKEGWIWFPES